MVHLADGNFTNLDSRYLTFDDVPPPLVLISWISQVKEQHEDLRNCVNEETSRDTLPSQTNRKRGRPKKIAAPVEESLSPACIQLASAENSSSDEDCLDNNVKNEYLPELQDKTTENDTPNLTKHITPQISQHYQCDQCSKRFKAESTLKYHKKIHSGDLHKCNDCGRGFVRKYELKYHERIHSRSLLECELCKKGFTTPELLKVHLRRHTGEKPFVCDRCPMSFPAASNLIQHKERHVTSKNFLCADCGQSFLLERSLAHHQLVHGEKTHVCIVCDKRWARKADLVEHMRVHTKEKPFVCTDCPKRFSQSSSLRRHIITCQQSADKPLY